MTKVRLTIVIIFLLASAGCKIENSIVSENPDFIFISNVEVNPAGKALDKYVIRELILNPDKVRTNLIIEEGNCALSSVQQALLDAHNQARSVGRNCGSTFHAATAPLTWDCALAEISDEHNRDMGDNNFFSHTGSDGLQIGNRATNAGYSWQTVGENIAAGQRSVDAVMQAWLDSPGHCVNIMRPQFKEMGSDLYNASGSTYPTYWTTAFGTKRNF